MHRLPRLLMAAMTGFWVVAPWPARADIVHLKDGSTLQGDVRSSGESYVVVADDGSRTTVRADQVQSVEVNARTGAGGADSAMMGLESLRRAVRRVDDAGAVIGRYQQFIQRYAGTAAAQAAQRDLETWQERQRQGLVPLGDQWMTLQQRRQKQDRAQALAVQAAERMTQGQTAEGDALAGKALAEDPDDASALYLRALVLAGRGELASARKALEASDDALPQQGPTLNNLAVLLWRQNQRTTALHLYELALAASPLDRRILDNVAEALHSTPQSGRGGGAAQRTGQRFSEQEARMQEALAAEGWYRWGSGWVNQTEMARLQAAQQEADQRARQAEQDAQQARQQIDRIDSDIASYQQSIQQIESGIYTRDAKGNLVRLPYPQIYYDLQQKVQTLQDQRNQAVNQAGALQQDAKRIRDQAPQPRFTGIHHLIGPEGMPLVARQPAQAPTTAPGQ